MLPIKAFEFLPWSWDEDDQPIDWNLYITNRIVWLKNEKVIKFNNQTIMIYITRGGEPVI